MKIITHSIPIKVNKILIKRNVLHPTEERWNNG